MVVAATVADAGAAAEDATAGKVAAVILENRTLGGEQLSAVVPRNGVRFVPALRRLGSSV